MYQGNWDACITTLQRHLQMPSATWADERAASMRYMAKAYKKKGNVQTARLVVSQSHYRGASSAGALYGFGLDAV